VSNTGLEGITATLFKCSVSGASLKSIFNKTIEVRVERFSGGGCDSEAERARKMYVAFIVIGNGGSYTDLM
jgi:hypothetical protein